MRGALSEAAWSKTGERHEIEDNAGHLVINAGDRVILERRGTNARSHARSL